MICRRAAAAARFSNDIPAPRLKRDGKDTNGGTKWQKRIQIW